MNEDKVIKNMNIITLPLKRIQLDYSQNAIKYIQTKKKVDIKNLYEILSKRIKPQIYKLSVYLYDNINGIDLYHVYGQEKGSWGNAFILGSLLLDKSLTIDENKIAIIGVIHNDDTIKWKLEISNLNELFGGGHYFKRDPANGEILPVYTADGMIKKSVITIQKNKPITKTIHNLPITKEISRPIQDVYSPIQEVYHHIQEVHPPPPFGCPEGFSNCVSNCNYYMQNTKEDKRCSFICKLGKDLRDCNESCTGYLKLPNERHCCTYEFNSSCEYNRRKEMSSWRKI